MAQDVNIEEKKRPFPIIALLPLLFVVVFLGVVFFELTSGKDKSSIPSALLGKAVPEFSLPPLEGALREGEQIPGFDNEVSKGAPVTLINVWASWCIPCRAEHPYVKALGKDERIRLYGLNHKDPAEGALSFLDELGNPFDAIGVDRNGRVGVEFGVYGVPETFVVNQEGIIIHKFIGPITQSRLRTELMPAIEEALAN